MILLSEHLKKIYWHWDDFRLSYTISPTSFPKNIIIFIVEQNRAQ